MDKTTRYQNIIIEYLNEFANFGKPRPGIEKEVIADRERNHFQFVTTGWQDHKTFVYIVGLHLDIKDGKYGFGKTTPMLMLVTNLWNAAFRNRILSSLFMHQKSGNIRGLLWRKKSKMFNWLCVHLRLNENILLV